MKYVLMPPRKGGPHCRLSSPSGGGSIFSTSAPMSARSIVHTGPDRMRERSTTNTSSSGLILCMATYSKTLVFIGESVENRPRPIYYLDPGSDHPSKNVERKAQNVSLHHVPKLKSPPYLKLGTWPANCFTLAGNLC